MAFHQYESDCEEALFLPQIKNAQDKDNDQCTKHPWRSWRIFHAYHFIYIAVCANFVWSAANLRTTTSSRCRELPTIYEPFDIPVEYRSQSWNLPVGVKTPFTSFDIQEADEAWKGIEVGNDLGVFNLKADHFHADQQASTIEFDDHSGYLFVGDVFHQLHCLNYIRKKTVLYKHMCRDFAHVRAWALDHAATLKGSLSHPELGPVGESPLNLSALPVWQEEYDHSVEAGSMPICLPS